MTAEGFELTGIEGFRLRRAVEADVPLILRFIHELAKYEKLSTEVVATEEVLRASLFGERRGAEVVLGFEDEEPVAFALFFHNFSTFLGRPGLYLEDLFVDPQARGKGYGRVLLAHLARLALKRGCGRLEWWVLDWNEPAWHFYASIGARPMEEWTVHRMDETAMRSLADEF